MILLILASDLVSEFKAKQSELKFLCHCLFIRMQCSLRHLKKIKAEMKKKKYILFVELHIRQVG